MNEQNMMIYEAVRSVPKEAQKPFNNGRFSGTDVNPMWRLKTLTEQFGPAGIGWYTEVISERQEQLDDQTVMAIVDINLYIKYEGEWSKPIFGTGGNTLVAKGKPNDEGYKMAYTDALSVACKALGIGADVYFSQDMTKYTDKSENDEKGKNGAQNASGKKEPEEAIRNPNLATVDQITEIRLKADDNQYAACVATYGQNLERMPYLHAVALLKKLNGGK